MKKVCGFVLLSLFLMAPLSAGVVFEVETKEHDSSPPTTSTSQMLAEGKHLKMSIAEGPRGSEGEVIYRGDQREMVVVDHDSKSYFVIDEEAMAAIAGQVGAAMKQVEAALEGVPADQRAMIEEMMKKQLPGGLPKAGAAPARPQSEVRRTSEKATISGYPCVKYEVTRDGRKMRELWVTEWGNVEGGSDVRGSFEEMSGFFKEMMDTLAESGGGLFGTDSFDTSAVAEIREVDGFPVAIKDFADDGSLENESELRSASRRTLDPAEFEPPSGYKRQQMPGGF